MSAPAPTVVPCPENQAQRLALKEITGLFGVARVRFWLRGGWALDFLLGQETRPHGDLDLVVWAKNGPKVQKVLTGAGYRPVERGLSAQLDFVREREGEPTVKVSVVLIERQPSGELTPRGMPQWVWLASMLGPARQLGDLRCHTLSAEQLMHEKYTYEGQQPLRPKDLESLSLLAEVGSGGKK